MTPQYDIARLAQLRNEHSELRARYARSAEKIRQAASEVAASRREAPPRLVNLKLPKHAFAEGIRHNPVKTSFEDFDEAYQAPVDVLRAHAPEDFKRLQLDARAVQRIITATDQLEMLREEHRRLSAAVATSCAFMDRVETFAKENRL